MNLNANRSVIRDGRTCDCCGGPNLRWLDPGWSEHVGAVYDGRPTGNEGYAGLVLFVSCFVELVEQQAGPEAALSVAKRQLRRRQEEAARARARTGAPSSSSREGER